MSDPISNPSTHSGMLKTIVAAFITIIVFIGLAFVWFKESPTALLKPTSEKSTNNILPSLSYNDDKINSTTDKDNSLVVGSATDAPKIDKTQTPLEKSEKHTLFRENTATEQLNKFFTQLDTKPYYKNTFAEAQSKEHFTTLLRKIIDNPPVVSGEADDLFTLLQNTAHFFRILGGKDIALTKKIVSDNKQNIEQLAADLYVVLNNKDILLKDYQIDSATKSLYSYGCFFLNTMGGRLYMFRRDIEMRMLLSYYSLLFVYYAEIDGENYNGIDVRPFLKTLIYEMENYGQNLKQRDVYLARLYNLENSLN